MLGEDTRLAVSSLLIALVQLSVW